MDLITLQGKKATLSEKRGTFEVEGIDRSQLVGKEKRAELQSITRKNSRRNLLSTLFEIRKMAFYPDTVLVLQPQNKSGMHGPLLHPASDRQRATLAAK